ncbi:MAG: PKD domain-containing protein, partial [Candidatus Thermoplasmatota archaeon]|nr:PKD domain-containing protein [Candidatus Thermoplasmatota archaeon]
VWLGRSIISTSTILKVEAPDVVNGEFNASISICNATGFNSINMTLIYDDTCLYLEDIENGYIGSKEVNVSYNEKDGILRIIGRISGMADGSSGCISKIKFIPRKAGITSLNISDVTISNASSQPITAFIENKSLLIESAELNFPVANFSWIPPDPTDIDTIHFTDNSDDPDGFVVNWSWDFGDGNISYLQNATHSYVDDGIYNVTLEVTDNEGLIDNISKRVTVTNVPPSANFNYVPERPTVQDTIQFTDNSSDADGTIVNWTWSFGDGNYSYEKNAAHSYAYDGMYNVTLAVKDDDGATNTTSKEVTILKMQYNITASISPSNAGSILLSPVGGTYDAGTVVTATAHANAGYEFDHWGGDAEGTSASIQITMNSDKSIVAHFTETVERYTLTISVSPSGSGSIILDPSGGKYNEGTMVTATASPASSYEFDHWGESISGYSRQIHITMNSDKNIIAYFVFTQPPPPPTRYTLTVNVEPSNAGNVTLSPSGGTYDEGTEVTAFANANEGYEFSHWSGAAGGINSTVEILMNSDKTVTAHFTAIIQPNMLPSIVISSPSNGSTISGIVTVQGEAMDSDGHVQKVEIKIDSGSWKQVTEANPWSYLWDTTSASNGQHTLYVRAYDGRDYSNISSIKVNVRNEEGKKFPALYIAGMTIAMIVAVGAVLFVYMRKRR